MYSVIPIMHFAVRDGRLPFVGTDSYITEKQIGHVTLERDREKETEGEKDRWGRNGKKREKGKSERKKEGGREKEGEAIERGAGSEEENERREE